MIMHIWFSSINFKRSSNYRKSLKIFTKKFKGSYKNQGSGNIKLMVKNRKIKKKN